MPRGSGSKREREYDELVHDFEQEGRYKGREEEVAARILNKQRAQFSETKREKAIDRKGKSPDRNLPIPQYDHLTIGKVVEKLIDLSDAQVEKLRDYEAHHKNRKTLLEQLDRRLNSRR